MACIVRPAPEQAVFDRLVLPTTDHYRLAGITWSRLYKIAYPNQFYPSIGSRLTPVSLKIPCVYLASNLETAVAEVWGDSFYAQRMLGRTLFRINAAEADQYAFLSLRPPLPRLCLCDLTNADTRL